jgi:hypothetical protein
MPGPHDNAGGLRWREGVNSRRNSTTADRSESPIKSAAVLQRGASGMVTSARMPGQLHSHPKCELGLVAVIGTRLQFLWTMHLQLAFYRLSQN